MFGLCVSCGQVQELVERVTTVESWLELPLHAAGGGWCGGAGVRVEEGQAAERYEEVVRAVKMEESGEIEEGAEVRREGAMDKDVPDVTDDMEAGDEWDDGEEDEYDEEGEDLEDEF